MKYNIVCSDCNKNFYIDKEQYEYDIKLNDNFCCGMCYNINKISLLDDTYFNRIDIPEKGYLIGLFINSIIRINDNYLKININGISKTSDIYIIKVIKNITNKLDYNYYNSRNANVLSISVFNSNLVNSINNIINNINDYFDKFDDKIKIAFIRGYYENLRNLSDSHNKLYYYKIDGLLIEKIFTYINIPHINDYKNNCIIFSEINNIDFLGKIYKDAHNLCMEKYKYNILYPKCKVFKTLDEAVIPTKANESDAGYDLTIIKEEKQFNKKTKLYDTGIKVEIDYGYYIEIVPRSSLSKSGYMLANSIGIIDNSYRGNLYIALTKIDDESPDLTLPFKCCQMIIRKQFNVDLFEVNDKFVETKRNKGGFGSSNKEDIETLDNP